MPDVWYVIRRGGGRYMGRRRLRSDAEAVAVAGVGAGWTDVEIVKDVLTRTTETVWRDGRHITKEGT